MAAEYLRQNTVFRQRIVVIPRPDQKLFHAFIYTAPKEDYDTYESIAKAMLASWTLR